MFRKHIVFLFIDKMSVRPDEMPLRAGRHGFAGRSLETPALYLLFYF